MFDSYTISPRPQTVYQKTTVHEHRAPTDESVALLKDMEEKARDKVIKSVAVENNSFNCVFHSLKDVQSDRLIGRSIFMLNGERMTVEESVSPMDVKDKSELVLKLRDAMAKKIANEILSDAIHRVNF